MCVCEIFSYGDTHFPELTKKERVRREKEREKKREQERNSKWISRGEGGERWGKKQWSALARLS